MELTPLQKARYEYSPKLPGMLRQGISEICVKEGAQTSSAADQEKIQALFPNTYGKKEITFEKGSNTSTPKKQVVGVILSGGQAPGGHNVADCWKMTTSFLTMLTSISTAIPAALISSVPAARNWKPRNSLQ